MKNKIVDTLQDILKINSPTGYTGDVISHIEKIFGKSDLHIRKSNKGGLLISYSEDPELVLTAHIDTLGAMIKELKGDGTIEITQLGSYPLNSFEGEYVTIRKDVYKRQTYP